jgi:hypothetical protein
MKKRKSHNPIKRLITQSKIAVRDVALVMTFADDYVELVKQKSGKPVQCGQSVAAALDRTAFDWFVVLVVYCLESNKKQKLVMQPLKLSAPYRHSDLTDFLRAEHQRMIDECKLVMTVLNAGFAAIPVPYGTEEEMERDLLRLLDVGKHWDHRQAERVAA